MHDLLESSSPFLFPCTIEFSLICAAILFIMWKHVSGEHEYYKLARLQQQHATRALPDVLPKRPGRYSVDCRKASTGLFLGIIVLTITIISLIVFFVFISHPDPKLRLLAVQVTNETLVFCSMFPLKVAAFSELSMYSLTSTAVMLAMCQMRRLEYDNTHTLELDNLLLVIAQTGVFIYAAFSIIGTFFQVRYP